MLGFFRRRIVFQQQSVIGGYGRAGNAGAAGATGPAGATGAAGPSGLGPTQTNTIASADVLTAAATPLELVAAQVGRKLVPIITWTETNVTSAGSNNPTLTIGYTITTIGPSYGSLLSTARNTGNLGLPNLPTETAAFGVKLASTGVHLQIQLGIAPTGSPVCNGRSFCLYFAALALVP